MTMFRSRLKRAAPPRLKAVLRTLRALAAPPPVDAVMVRDYGFAPDPAPGLRLNLVLPDMAPATAFGGVLTGLEIFLRLAQALARHQPVETRIIVADTADIAERSVLARVAAGLGYDLRQLSIVSIVDPAAALPTRAGDLFVAFNWWTSLNLRPLIGAQAAHYRAPRRPLIYLIQEYEPQLYAFSSTHMLARDAYDGAGPLWGVFNSALLFAYFADQGHRVARSWVFEPAIHDQLRGRLAAARSARKQRRIIVYGRPAVARNCFAALVRGLQRWAQRYPQFRDWEVVSAGTPHRPIALPDGRQVVSVGKIALPAYADLLTDAAVGMALMASPHPSYPPIEMAHFGLHVVTNGYAAKNLARLHPNIRSVASISADALADALAGACAAFLADPAAAAAQPPLASFLRTDPFGFVDDLALAIMGISEAPPLR